MSTSLLLALPDDEHEELVVQDEDEEPGRLSSPGDWERACLSVDIRLTVACLMTPPEWLDGVGVLTTVETLP